MPSHSQLATHAGTTLALFCKVVDNYGDIGICWRLARQLAEEHGVGVTLWVDDLRSFQRICPSVATGAGQQQVGAVTVRHWRDQHGAYTVGDIADIVIEFFGCDIPPAYIVAMSQRTPRPAWLNLEGLTAEKWVEGCHTLPSPHPSLPLTKYFFFPGFNARTGGLLRERELEQQRRAFVGDQAAMATFLGQFGVTANEMASTKVSMFCYADAPLAALFAAWKYSNGPITCLIPEGVASDAVHAFLGRAATAGASAVRGALTVRVIPFVPQPDYDRLLWACDLNFVRGEDSFVRAQWANRPFIWHIYPQDENLHHVKLEAFLQTCTAQTDSAIQLSRAWNAVGGPGTGGVVNWPALWAAYQADLPELGAMSVAWEQQMVENGDLATNLLRFVETVK